MKPPAEVGEKYHALYWKCVKTLIYNCGNRRLPKDKALPLVASTRIDERLDD